MKVRVEVGSSFGTPSLWKKFQIDGVGINKGAQSAIFLMKDSFFFIKINRNRIVTYNDWKSKVGIVIAKY